MILTARKNHKCEKLLVFFKKKTPKEHFIYLVKDVCADNDLNQIVHYQKIF